jgi:thioredoxin-like negative regulator of GroEL
MVAKQALTADLFKRCLAFLAVVLSVAFMLQWTWSRSQLTGLPSSYSNGVSLPALMQQRQSEGSKKPLLVEFYQDSCERCRLLTPELHALFKVRLKPYTDLVLVNAEDPKQAMILELFGVKTLPAVFWFSPAPPMKKHPVPVDRVQSRLQLCQTLEQSWQDAKLASSPPKKMCD